jgi:hypothetical protein
MVEYKWDAVKLSSSMVKHSVMFGWPLFPFSERLRPASRLQRFKAHHNFNRASTTWS